MPLQAAWTTAAANELDKFCLRHQPQLPVAATQQQINENLASALPEEDVVIVLGMFFGFRVRSNEYVLLIDTGHGTVIAKLAQSDCLQREDCALRSATRLGFDGNQVFLPMQAVPNARAPLALLYKTAQSRIDLPDTKSLEEVFISAVQHEAPTTESVGEVIRELFDALGKECYGRSGVRQLIETNRPAGLEDIGLNPSSGDGLRHCLGDSLDSWNTCSAVMIRRDSIASFPIRRNRSIFIDPVDFFAEMLTEVRELIHENSEAASARLAALVPRVLVGCSHGDLHGRNAIVGIENNSAAFDALTLPPYKIGKLCASALSRSASRLRINACTSWACCGVAVLPVPMAHTGS